MTDEQRCLEILFHAEAAQSAALSRLLARQNLAYLKMSQSLTRQKAALRLSIEAAERGASTETFDDVIHREEIIIESLWADCLADFEEIVRSL